MSATSGVNPKTILRPPQGLTATLACQSSTASDIVILSRPAPASKRKALAILPGLAHPSHHRATVSPECCTLSIVQVELCPIIHQRTGSANTNRPAVSGPLAPQRGLTCAPFKHSIKRGRDTSSGRTGEYRVWSSAGVWTIRSP